MSEHFAAWTKGSHHAVATCNDCHTPHNLRRQVRGEGAERLLALVLLHDGRLPRSAPHHRAATGAVTESACRYCHAEITEAIDHVAVGAATAPCESPRDPRARAASRPHDAGTARAASPSPASAAIATSATGCADDAPSRRAPTDAHSSEHAMTDPHADPPARAATPRRDSLARPRRASAARSRPSASPRCSRTSSSGSRRRGIPFYRVVALDDTTDDPAVWGKNFPLQYDDYRKTVDQVRTRYGGSEGEPHTPTAGGSALGRRAVAPRGGPAASRVLGRLRVRAGLPRGARPRLHARRPGVHRAAAASPSSRARACTATRSMYVPYMRAGDGDLIKGFETLNPMPYFEARKLVQASRGVHRLPRPGQHAAARHAPRLHRRDPRAQGEPGRRRTTT